MGKKTVQASGGGKKEKPSTGRRARPAYNQGEASKGGDKEGTTDSHNKMNIGRRATKAQPEKPGRAEQAMLGRIED